MDQQSTPAYTLLVEPEYDHLEEYNQVEEEGISSRLFMASVFAIVVPLILIIIAIGVYTLDAEAQARKQVTAETTYPVLLDSRASSAAQLNDYALVDPANGIYRIPIEEAMKMRADQKWQEQLDTEAGQPTQ